MESLEQFSETLRRQCISLAILDDNIAEGTEMGTVTLQIAVGDVYPQFQINPASTTIRIIDDECKNILPANIIEYGSTLYVGMTRKKNGGPIKRVQNRMFRTLPWM